jgi:murein DD-endopeptidase MepM/ murein hydrolase activator NlpD
MEVLIRDKNTLVQNLSAEEIELNNQLEQFEQDKKQIEAELVELAKQNALKKSITPSKSGYISPLLGKTKANITTTYNGYAGHTGVDFAIPLGTDVVAVKAGTVVISDALKYSNGKYKSYGEYVVIDHHDGTMTLYAHGLADSRTVVEGDEVEQGDVIMLSGSTGNSTGPHLHFEVRVNGKCVEPSQYLP